MNYNILLGDALTLFKDIEDETIDCIVTDPPYETISGGSNENAGVNRPGGILSKNDGKIFEHNDLDIGDWIGECYRVLKQNTHIYIMTNFLNLEKYLHSVREAGFDIHNLLIWEKNTVTPNRWYMKNAEYIIFGRKGEAKPINDCGSKTILSFNNVSKRIHPTEKPIDLLKLLITNSTKPGETVLDPFGGSMSTVRAALLTGRKAIAFELDDNYYEAGLKSVESIQEEDVEVIVPPAPRLTDNQQKIYEFLRQNPEQDFSAQEIGEFLNIPIKTCSGCLTPLMHADLIVKTNNKSPFRVKIK